MLICMNRNDKRYEVVPYIRKVRAIEELELGIITGPELKEKYRISDTTLSNWKKQVKRGYAKTSRHFPASEKIKSVNQILSGLKTKEEIQKSFDLEHLRTIDSWIAKYGNIVEENKPLEQVNDLAANNLKQELSQARLQILALESLISSAEKELKISIRKKYGTKQSEK